MAQATAERKSQRVRRRGLALELCLVLCRDPWGVRQNRPDRRALPSDQTARRRGEPNSGARSGLHEGAADDQKASGGNKAGRGSAYQVVRLLLIKFSKLTSWLRLWKLKLNYPSIHIVQRPLRELRNSLELALKQLWVGLDVLRLDPCEPRLRPSILITENLVIVFNLASRNDIDNTPSVRLDDLVDLLGQCVLVHLTRLQCLHSRVH